MGSADVPPSVCIIIISHAVAYGKSSVLSWTLFSTNPALTTIQEVFKFYMSYVRFEVSKSVTMKNGVFYDVSPCGSSKNRRFGGI
jgi:hypothetical protein